MWCPPPSPAAISHRNLSCKPQTAPNKRVKRQQQCEQYGTVRTPGTGTSVIRRAHNGSAQVAQVVVCHALCAVHEIEWKAFPQSWQSPQHVCVKKPSVCVFCVCVWGVETGSENEPVNVQMCLSLIICILYSHERMANSNFILTCFHECLNQKHLLQPC